VPHDRIRARAACAFAPDPALFVGSSPDQVVPAVGDGEAVAPRATPRAEVHAQRGVGARDPHRAPGRRRPQRAGHQEVPAFVQAQAAEIQRRLLRHGA
jgi:hypothetical protein